MDVSGHGRTLTPHVPRAHSMPQTVYAERETMISRGDLFSASLDPVVGSEQGGIRPVLVIQNDVGQPLQPHGDRAGHHRAGEQGAPAHPRARPGGQHGAAKGQRRACRADTHAGQTPPARAHRFAAPRRSWKRFRRRCASRWAWAARRARERTARARREDDPGASTQEGDVPFLSQRLQCILSIRAASDTKILEKRPFSAGK